MGKLICLLLFVCAIEASVFSQPGNCIPTGFQKKIIGPLDDRATDVVVTPFNEYLVAGLTTSETGIAENYDAFLIKLDQYGNMIWQKRIGGTRYDDFSKLLVLRNGNYVAMGTTKSNANVNGNFFILQFDTAGNILYQRELNMLADSHIRAINITSLLELEDGNIAFCGNAEGINTDVGQPLNATFNIVGIVDATLELKWFQRMRLYYAESGMPMNGMVATKSSLVAIISNGILKISIKDGYLIGMQKHLQFLDEFKTIERNGDKLILFSNDHRAILDTNFNLISTHRIGFSPGNYRGNLLRRTDMNGNLIWSYLYPHTSPKSRIIGKSQLTIDKGLIAVGTAKEDEDNFLEPNDVFLIRTDSMGRITECPRSGYIYEAAAVTPQIWELYMRYYPLQTGRYFPQVVSTPLHFSILDVCNNICQNFKLTGRDTLCNLNDTLTLTLSKNRECIAITEWDYDSSLVRIIKLNDTSLALVGKKQGVIKVRARSAVGCQILQDSILLNIFASPPTLNLGSDVELCMVKSYKLNAGKGFKSYLWSDGSSDSTLTVTAAGIYFLATTDYCGKQYHDTVNVTESTGSNFDIGADLNKCNDDSLAITAPSGFTNYKWTPDYNIVGINSPTAKLFPSVDTTYKITAEKGNGCIVMDSIFVKVNHSPIIDLGKDSSLCKGDSLVLNAGNGFIQYLWSNGAASPSITVKDKGTYSIVATDINSCVSKDELVVQSVFALPNVNLGPDTIYCKNERFELIAPAGQAKYEWSNGLTSSIIQINSPGNYWVKVTSRDGCISRDTVSLAAKECLKGVFFPNAFTPNNDRTNNSFKPVVHGNLESFYFVIYNRYGQKVFETKDPKRGWDGTINGKQQASAAFIWTAQYKFTGEKMETIKGSLVLIR